MKVKNRLLLYYAISLGVLLLFFILSLTYSLNFMFDLKVKDSLQSIALDIQQELDKNTINKNGFVIKPIYFEVYKNKKPILKSKNLQKDLPLIKNEFEEIDIPFISKEDESALYRLDFNNYSIIVATPLDKIDDVLEIFIVVSVIFAFLLYMILLFVGYWLINGAIEPMKKIVYSVKNIDNINERVYLPKNKDEFYELAKTFNELLDKLQKSYEKIKRFNANVSHELKTPLTIMQAEIEFALKKDRKIDEYKETLLSIQEEVESMKNIIDSLLILTKSKNIPKEDVRIDKILIDVIQERNAKNIILQKIEPAVLKANKNLIKLAFSNILDNAIKYTPSSKMIKISLEKNSHIVCRVEDEGVGIKKENIDKVFEPFFREDNSHSKEIEGYGLGLSLVKWIVQAHNGKIAIKSEKNRGTTVTITLPY